MRDAVRRRVWLAVLAAAAAFGTYFTLSVFPTDSLLYDKDFGQEYLLARAIRDGVDPYQPVKVLAARYVQATGYLDKEHPTPHPPTVGLLALPLGFLSYPVAVRTWFGLELLCVFLVVILLTRGVRLPIRPRLALLLAPALVAWPPITVELGLGQLMLPLLLGLAGAQVALLGGRPVLGGVLLAVTLLIKPITWPWLIVLTWRRDWRALAAAAIVVVGGGVLSLAAIGVDATTTYLFRVLPEMSTVYFAEPTNLSLWTVAPRLGLTIPSATLPAAVLVGATWIACRRAALGDALAIMTVASLLISPITWYFYFTLALIPMVQVVSAVQRRGLRVGDIAAAVCVFGLLSLREDLLVAIARAGAGANTLMAPVLGLVLLGILLTWLTRKSLV